MKLSAGKLWGMRRLADPGGRWKMSAIDQPHQRRALAGAGPADFQRSLSFAYRACASGYLCGRAIWQQAFERFPDLPAMEHELASASVRYVQQINALTDRLAMPWQRHAAWRGEVAMAGDGPEFAAQYPAG